MSPLQEKGCFSIWLVLVQIETIQADTFERNLEYKRGCAVYSESFKLFKVLASIEGNANNRHVLWCRDYLWWRLSTKGSHDEMFHCRDRQFLLVRLIKELLRVRRLIAASFDLRHCRRRVKRVHRRWQFKRDATMHSHSLFRPNNSPTLAVQHRRYSP